MGRVAAEPIGTDDHVLSMGSSAIRDVEVSSHLPSWPFWSSLSISRIISPYGKNKLQHNIFLRNLGPISEWGRGTKEKRVGASPKAQMKDIQRQEPAEGHWRPLRGPLRRTWGQQPEAARTHTGSVPTHTVSPGRLRGRFGTKP